MSGNVQYSVAIVRSFEWSYMSGQDSRSQVPGPGELNHLFHEVRSRGSGVRLCVPQFRITIVIRCIINQVEMHII